MASIRDVAEKAGVSTATVSRVLNKDERVKEETRAKIQAVIDELGYRPNRLATSLRRQDSNLVALFLENQKSPFATMLYASIEKTCMRKASKSSPVAHGEKRSVNASTRRP